MVRLRFTEKLLHRLNLLPQPIFDAFLQPLLGRAVMVSHKLGLFERLLQRPQSAEDIAEELRLSVEGVKLLLQVLDVAGYVRRSGDRFEATAVTRKWLDRRSAHSIEDLVAYFETLFARWGYLDDTVRRGSPHRMYFELFTPEDWRVYTHGMMSLARLLMPQVLRHVRLAREARRLLDIGGSHGLYSIELCRRYSELRAAVVEYSEVAVHGRRIVRDAGMADRISYVEGDFLSVDLGSSYDAALAFNVIHGLTWKQSDLLASRVYDVLRPGGTWFILDEFALAKKSSFVGRLVPAVVGLHLFNETGGRTYKTEEVRRMCKGAGFSDISVALLGTPGVAVLQCVKR